ncbi:MAG: FKBP-type peptidyl-prolyl cis-trans isomerase [Bacteroidota bacterium]|nr:FKBP-type peptidyl-prolyl cis-trans isomerase [Bacteroidota bacterium]
MKKLSILLVTMLIAFAGCKKDKVDQGAIDNKLILAYIQANNLDAKHTGSGLYYVVTKPGDSTRPTSTSTVYIKYRGYLLSGTQKGTQFDSSYELYEQPAQLTMLNLIKGFSEGLKLFGKGGQGELIVPSGLAYGSTATTTIPANSVLIFDFELDTFN